MPNARLTHVPVEYIYFDSPGIERLYAQIVQAVETTRTTMTQRGTAGRVGAGLRLKNVLAKLTGLEGEVSTEVTGTSQRGEQSTRIQTVEHRLNGLIDYRSQSGEGCYITNLSEAARHLQKIERPLFIYFRDTFNAPQFYGGALGTDSVNAEGYVLFEKGGTADYNDGDDYYKQSTALVKMSASTKKMRSEGSMGASSHDATYIRGFGGRRVPLSVFGTVSGTPDYLQIKPFAIWK